MNRLAPLVLPFLLVTASCATSPIDGRGDVGAPTAVNATVVVDARSDERALLAAELAFQAVNRAASLAVDVGALRPGSERAVTVADALVAARGHLQRARAAYSVADRVGDARAALDMTLTELRRAQTALTNAQES